MNDNDRMKELIRLLGEAARAYYQEDREIMSNLEYDRLYEELEGHEQQLRVLSGALLCGACGAENEEGSVYCRNCGQPLSRG